MLNNTKLNCLTLIQSRIMSKQPKYSGLSLPIRGSLSTKVCLGKELVILYSQSRIKVRLLAIRVQFTESLQQVARLTKVGLREV